MGQLQFLSQSGSRLLLELQLTAGLVPASAMLALGAVPRTESRR